MAVEYRPGIGPTHPIMRAHYTFIALVIAGSAPAQLINNASFENALGGDLSYWNHACIAQSIADPAPSSGSWCVEVEASNPQGCLPGLLYQATPGGYDGMPFFLGGWCRNTAGPWAPVIGLDIGVMSAGGVITPMNLDLTTTDTTWTWLSTNDTLNLAFGEQAVVICNPGFVGGPAFALARFDGILFFETFPFSVDDGPTFTNSFDLINGSLTMNCANAKITAVRLMDITGRALPCNTEGMGSRTVRVGLATLLTGVYIAIVRTDRGEKAVRFVVP